ncbi:hypothetical protein JK164_12245 [Gluconobacter kondonii]|uniref:hypothetical protein n=1 Tax=Gluconobacter kondonii TaxID=941463 RepID=UPI001B8C74DE|nr:hypothetical protein [Gluconobacter kondonii]MBS1066707.1 hypothetical protein [Gluconobacter kondonii]
MNCAFSSYIKEILENSKRLNSRYEFKVGDFFNENFCFNNTNLISENISYEILSGDFPCRELLQDSNSFSGDIFHPSTIHAFYWSFNKAIQIHWDTYARVDRKEDVQNSGLFGTIALSLETIKYLTQDKGCFDKFSLYTADCVTDGSESELGSDFAFIIPCDEDTYKIALFQAKKADFDGSGGFEKPLVLRAAL